MSLRHEILTRASEINAIAARYGVGNLRLYGSVARQEEQVHSDVDLLATFDEGITYTNLFDLEQTLTAMFQKPVHVSSDFDLPPRFADRIADDIIELKSQYV